MTFRRRDQFFVEAMPDGTTRPIRVISGTSEDLISTAVHRAKVQFGVEATTAECWGAETPRTEPNQEPLIIIDLTDTGKDPESPSGRRMVWMTLPEMRNAGHHEETPDFAPTLTNFLYN